MQEWHCRMHQMEVDKLLLWIIFYIQYTHTAWVKCSIKFNLSGTHEGRSVICRAMLFDMKYQNKLTLPLIPCYVPL